MAQDDAKKAMTEKYIIYKLLQKNVEEMQKQKAMVEAQQQEVDNTLQGLKDMEKVPEDSEILIPLGMGCYGFGKLMKKGQLIVNLGANVMVKKDITSAIEIVNQKKKDLESALGELEKEIAKVSEALGELTLELQSIAEESKESKDK